MMSTKKYGIRLYRRTTGTQRLHAVGLRRTNRPMPHSLMSDESRSDGGMKDADITSALGTVNGRANTQAL